MKNVGQAYGHGIKLSFRYARICRNYEARDQTQEPDITGQWQRADGGQLENLRALVNAGNEVCGPGTHWIEIRHSTDPDLK